MVDTVVVVGGGYAGTMAARRLAWQRDLRVVHVTERPELVERIRLHQWVAGQDLPRRSFAEGPRSPELVVARVNRVDADADVVEFDDGRTLSYDLLVLATGSSAPTGPEPAVAAPERAVDLRVRLAGLSDGDTVMVVGGGLTGVETAAEVADARPELRVSLVTDALLPDISERARGQVRRRLARLGVDLREGLWVTERSETSVGLSDGQELQASLVVPTLGFGVSPLARDSGLAVDDIGRLRVDQTLRSVSHPRVIGAGDGVALPDGRQVRMSCQTAVPMGWHAADTVSRLSRGRTPRPFVMRFVGSNISLGRHDAVIQVSRRDDSPTRWVLTGRPAAWFKETVCRSTVLALGVRATGGRALAETTRPARV